MNFFIRLRYAVIAIAFLLVLAFLHYSLPDRDIVRIVGTEVVRIDNATQKDGTSLNRDQPRINTVWPNGSPRVYRNEDTDWGWPLYFKFDSANLQAQAQSYAKRQENYDWVVVRHYGWRIPILSMFPNALSIRDAEGPDEQLLPWFNIFLVASLLIVILAVWRVIRLIASLF